MGKVKRPKKFLSLVLCAALILSLGSVTAFAAEATVSTAEELASAVQTGGAIKLGANIEQSIVIPAGVTATLDLNGKTLTGTNKDAIYVSAGATLEVIDSVGGGKVQAAASGYAAVFNSGKATLSGGYYTRSANQWYTICNHGEMAINGGVTVKTTVDTVSSLVENGYSAYTANRPNERNNYVAGANSASPTLTINGGSFASAGYNPVKNDEGGVLNIYDGDFSCPTYQGAVVQNWNVANIYGGTFTASGNVACVISNGTWGEHAKGQLVIEGGTFVVEDEATDAKLFSNGQGSGAGGTVAIKGGDYTGEFDSSLMDAYYDTSISAGTFTSPDAADYAVQGAVAASLNATGKTYIGTAAAVNNTLNEKASKGDQVTVLCGDVDLTGLDQVAVINTGSGNVTVNDVPVADTPVTTHGNVTAVAEKEPTCTEDGNIAYWYCADCGKYFSDKELTREIAQGDTVVKATGHSAGAEWVSDGAQHWHLCTVCGDKVEAAEHTFNWVVEKEATATEKGSKCEACTVCGYKKAAVEIPATGENGAGNEGSDTAQTGDFGDVQLWVALLLVSAAGLAGAAVYGQRRKHNK
ncbi:hypothetical protein [Bittarella massiliensis (ex Durand et al. 2017)]|uniref:hypothetical protein n=1 Tax=Bittarella massiliensis (ex Durand et al. 2017) TaxID=1720313 RepID=UPI001AA0B688|nr:hypothetical protein [Bittarella massiliensis (ex Durand et al. 2017)]MBO1678970.1 hypothetical protein [Bittarella massiliensis (ex Durand et al. 2017)]